MSPRSRRLAAAIGLIASGWLAGPAARSSAGQAGPDGPLPACAPAAGTRPVDAAAPASAPATHPARTPFADGLRAPQDHLSPAVEQAMLDEIRRNVAWLRRSGHPAPARRAAAVTFDFPLRLAPGLPGDAGFYLSAFADHDPASGKVLDYNGGNRTYDGHKGIDYALWPFPWNKLDAGDVQVLAAAAGTIVAKADGNLADKHCGNAGDGGEWNYLALEHADGRMTIYGHLRHRSLTSKGVGKTVERGELLATAASSGNSSGPHLHFEVRAEAFAKEWIDPYAGPHSQAESLWSDQRPYLDSAINLLATHEGPPQSPDPCLPSQTRFQTHFTAPARVYLYAYYRDFQGSLPTEVRVLRPDGTVFRVWTYSEDIAFVRGFSHGWVAELAGDEPSGTWRVEASYNGRSHTTRFELDGAEARPTMTAAPMPTALPTDTASPSASTTPTASASPTAPPAPPATREAGPPSPSPAATVRPLLLPQLRGGRR